jgi:probable rRNA maturation factor
VDARVSKRRAEKMLRYLELGAVELSIALVDDAAMRELNWTYRGKNRPTDVLAFAMREGEHMGSAGLVDGVLGDVVISVDTARRQAKKRKRPLLDEMTMLLAHGLLHLLGYDHDTKPKEKVMFAKARDLEQAAARRRVK